MRWCGASEARISHAATPKCGLPNQGHTRAISCQRPSIPKFANQVPQNDANFGIGTPVGERSVEENGHHIAMFLSSFGLSTRACGRTRRTVARMDIRRLLTGQAIRRESLFYGRWASNTITCAGIGTKKDQCLHAPEPMRALHAPFDAALPALRVLVCDVDCGTRDIRSARERAMHWTPSRLVLASKWTACIDDRSRAQRDQVSVPELRA